MARARLPSEPQSARLTAEQIKIAIPRLKKRISELEEFDPSTLQETGGPEVTRLRAAIDDTLTEVFGHGTVEYKRYQPAAILSSGPVRLQVYGSGPDFRFREGYRRSRDNGIALLNQAIASLEERLANQPDNEVSAPDAEAILPGRMVFVVHGHAEGPREAIARYLEQLEFVPVILHERPNKGRTLLTKFREEAEGIGFAVVVMTPDDVGGISSDALHPRARQNVVFELGFFIGALGPGHVAAVLAGDLERPSDFEGVLYIPYEGDWKMKLAKELQAAGLAVDWNKVMGR